MTMCDGGGELHQAFASSATGPHSPTNQPRQPFSSQSAMRCSLVLACNGARLTSQLKWRKAGQPVRVIPYVNCAMLSLFYVYYGLSIVGAMSKLYLY